MYRFSWQPRFNVKVFSSFTVSACLQQILYVMARIMSWQLFLGKSMSRKMSLFYHWLRFANHYGVVNNIISALLASTRHPHFKLSLRVSRKLAVVLDAQNTVLFAHTAQVLFTKTHASGPYIREMMSLCGCWNWLLIRRRVFSDILCQVASTVERCVKYWWDGIRHIGRCWVSYRLQTRRRSNSEDRLVSGQHHLERHQHRLPRFVVLLSSTRK